MSGLHQIHPFLLGAAVMASFVLFSAIDARRKKGPGRYAGPFIFILLTAVVLAGYYHTPNPF